MASTVSRAEKVKRIFEKFDANRDGGLNREEMAALVVAVNPRFTFSDEQINVILNEVFRLYVDYIDGEKGLTFDGLLCTYDDGAGDLDRDFTTLGLDLNRHNTSAAICSVVESKEIQRVSDSNHIVDDLEISIQRLKAKQAKDGKLKEIGIDAVESKETQRVSDSNDIVEELEISIQRLKAKQAKDGKFKEIDIDAVSDSVWSRELEPFSEINFQKKITWEESGRDFAAFSNELAILRIRVDRGARSNEEAFDGHMAIARFLFDHQLIKHALESFTRALELDRTDALSHLWAGKCLYLLGRYEKSEEEFLWALEIAEVSGNKWDYLLHQIHLNLGIVLEQEDMVSKSIKHYREAAILCPTHFIALKLLGGALFKDGDYRAAEKALEEALFLKRDYADAHCELGLVLQAMGEIERAILEYQKAMDLRPGHVNATYRLGDLFMDIGRYRMASVMYGRVVEAWPSNWRALINRAVALSWVGGVGEDARKAMKEAFKMSYNNAESNQVIAHIKQLQERTDQSVNRCGDERRRIKDVLDETLRGYSKFMEGQRGLISKCLIPSYLLDDGEVVEDVLAAQPALTRGFKRMRAKQ